VAKINNTLAKSLILILRIYQCCIGSCLGNCCRFYPSCSAYAVEAIQTQGCWRGCYLALRRILRCHPWHSGGFDPVQEK
jgi:putative membrane protein insertion efficiency factor